MAAFMLPMVCDMGLILAAVAAGRRET